MKFMGILFTTLIFVGLGYAACYYGWFTALYNFIMSWFH